MSEISKYEAQKKKMQGLCDEHELVYRFLKDQYPIVFTISPAKGMDAQLSMLENVEEKGYRSPDSHMDWIFEDGVLTTKVTGGTFTISKVLRTKIENSLAKMISYWQQYFFRDILEKNVLRASQMPVIDEDEAEDPPDGAEPIEEFDGKDMQPDDDDGAQDDDDTDDGASLPSVLDTDDPDVNRAIAVVRSENKATTALLQRRLNIGYSKASRIMDTLENMGVVSVYKGGMPRDVLPYDLPDEEQEGDDE